MANLNVRGLPDATLATLTAKAKMHGLSREAYLRVLITEAAAAAIDIKHMRMREGLWPTADDGMAMDYVMLGFMEALKRAAMNGVSEDQLLAAIGAPEAPRSPAAAPTPAAGPTAPASATNRAAAAPNGVEIVSRQYTINQPVGRE